MSQVLIRKLSSYGVHRDWYQLLVSYFSGRKQRVKVWDKVSNLGYVTKGTPQGSLMRPFIYNIFTNVLLLMMEKSAALFNFNYAGDNTVSAFQGIFLNVETVLKWSCNPMINWFSANLMQAKVSMHFLWAKGKRNPAVI